MKNNFKHLETIILATTNPNKVREVQIILQQLVAENDSSSAFIKATKFVDLSEAIILFPHKELPEDVAETGSTFKENAIIKATAYYKHYHMACLCEDSGLSIRALDGAPGVHSSRYAGIGTSTEMNIEKVLSNLNQTKTPDKNAYFETVFALYYEDDGNSYTICGAGKVEGQINSSAKGSNGFGYDPIFIPDRLGHGENTQGKTFGEITPQEKQQLSHRAKALRNFFQNFLLEFKQS